jgi:hypothetical protein
MLDYVGQNMRVGKYQDQMMCARNRKLGIASQNGIGWILLSHPIDIVGAIVRFGKYQDQMMCAWCLKAPADFRRRADRVAA